MEGLVATIFFANERALRIVKLVLQVGMITGLEFSKVLVAKGALNHIDFSGVEESCFCQIEYVDEGLGPIHEAFNAILFAVHFAWIFLKRE